MTRDEDPLCLPKMSLEGSKIPTMNSGKKVLDQLEQLMDKNLTIDTPINGELISLIIV